MNKQNTFALRYGCCVNMITHTENVSGIDVIPVLKELGFDYADLSLSHLCALDEAVFSNVQSEILDIGLPLEACNNFFPGDLRLTGPEVNKDLINTYLNKALKRAAALGIKVIVFGSGLARMVPQGFSMSQASSQLDDLLGILDKYAKQYDITIAIEPLRKQECNIVNTYSEALILARTANSANIGCLLDSYHLNAENENISVIQNDIEKLAHVHFAEQVGRVFPRLENKQTYKKFFSHLKEVGYCQRLSIEAYSENYIYDAKKALKLLKDIENELNYEL